jgi:hypothetical protein
MIYAKFKYVSNQNGEIVGINSILDNDVNVVNGNFFADEEWGYAMIEGDISSYDLSSFTFSEITQEEALSIYKSVYTDAILLENGFFGHPERAENLQVVEPSESEKMLDPAKWGIPYRTN